VAAAGGTREFRVHLVVRRVEGLPPASPAAAESASPEREAADAVPHRAVAAEVRWKGPRASALGSLRRAAVRRNRTRGEAEAAWEEEFESVVTLAAASQREGVAFQRWEIHGVQSRSTAAGASSAGTVDGGSGPLSSWQKYQPLPHR